jgi:hypothetical protein
MNDTHLFDIESQMDGLVCGDLDEASRSRLLDWLDADPTRWRKCGLAFLEAQLWGQALGEPSGTDPPGARLPVAAAAGRIAFPQRAVNGQVARGSLRATVVGRPQSRANRASVTLPGLVWAACTILAFAAGVVSQPYLSRQAEPPQVSAASGAAGQLGRQPVERTLPGTQAAAPISHKAAGPTLASVTVRRGPGPLNESTIHVPVVDSGEPARDAGAIGAKLPDYVRQQWERRGFAVETLRRYLYANLPSGERVLVPVESVQFQPRPIRVY